MTKYLLQMYQTNYPFFHDAALSEYFQIIFAEVGFDGPMNVILRIRQMIQL